MWRQINEDYYEYYIPTVYYTPEGIVTEEDDFDDFDLYDEPEDVKESRHNSCGGLNKKRHPKMTF